MTTTTVNEVGVKHCPFCQGEIMALATKCRHCGEFTDGRSSGDELNGGWIALIWLSLFVPYVGGFVIVILSSILYYSWRVKYPNKAKAINKHAWLAFLVSFLIWFGLGLMLGLV